MVFGPISVHSEDSTAPLFLWPVPRFRRIVAAHSLPRPDSDSRLVHVGFVVHQVELGAGFFLLAFLPPLLHKLTTFAYHQFYITKATDSVLQ